MFDYTKRTEKTHINPTNGTVATNIVSGNICHSPSNNNIPTNMTVMAIIILLSTQLGSRCIMLHLTLYLSSTEYVDFKNMKGNDVLAGF